MKLFNLIIIYFCSSFCINAWASSSKIEGSTIYFSEKKIFISYQDSLGKYITDSTEIDSEGHFQFIIDKVIPTRKVFLRLDANNYFYLFMEPGYHVRLNFNLKDPITFKRTKTISGNGSIGNLFRFKLDSIETYLRGNFYEKNEGEFLKILEQNYQTLANTIYLKEQVDKTDLSLSYIMEVNYLDLQFWKMQHIIDYISFSKNFSKEKKVAFLQKNTTPVIYANLFNENFIKSDKYLELMCSGSYSNYSVKLDENIFFDTLTVDDKRILITKEIRETFKGRIMELALNSYMTSSINRIESYEILQRYKNQFEELYASQDNKEVLSKVIAQKEMELFLTRKGVPPAMFSMIDKNKQKFNLSNFKGKVIYIDLWASWCIPCREETVHIKKLQAFYKEKKEFLILSIAVLDKEKNWITALKQDKPTWLQFFDNKNEAKEVFLPGSGYSIPRFILIDKKGDILDFDAPRPSDPKLKTLIDTALKQEI